MTAELTRRTLLKAQAAAVAAAAAGIALPASAQPVSGGVNALKIKWSKAPCRFCGTGCGVRSVRPHQESCFQSNPVLPPSVILSGQPNTPAITSFLIGFTATPIP